MRLHPLALALLLATGARAEIWIAPGNALNPAPVNPSTAGRWLDEEGIGTRIPAARTPSGQLYNMPLDPGAEEEDAPQSGWRTSGFVEAGGIRIGGDERAAGFRQYKDLKDGAYLNLFGFMAEKPDAARFLEATGGAVGMDDQFYRLRFGRYNDWRVTAFYDGIPHVTTTRYRSLWNGVGTGNLALATLTPGGTTNAATTQSNILDALAATGESSLETIRKRAGVRVEAALGEAWKVHASVTDEKRKGARPFGAVFGGGGGGGNLEVPETIDYDTLDLVAGAHYTGAASSFNLRASASFFRNEVDAMVFQNPLFISLNGTNGLAPATFTHGRFDLAPDNQHFNVKGEYARVLPQPFRGNFTAAVAVGSMRQDDNLMAPTDLPLTGGTVAAGGASLANAWNTPAALSRETARARIDTALADFSLAMKPAAALDVKAKLRYYETDNAMQYEACNPLTGQWGRLLNEGSGLSIVTAHAGAGVNPAGTSPNAFNAASCNLEAVRALGLVPSAGNVPIRSIPADYRQVNASLAGDYRLGLGRSFDALVERETFRRELRERDETREDRIKLGFADRRSFEGTLRVTYEHSRRGGSDYNPDPYAAAGSSSFGPLPAANGVAVQSWFQTFGQFRSFDLADRRQDVLNGRIDYAFHQNLDGAMSVQLKDARYPARYGRTGHQRTNSVTLDLNYQSGSAMVLYTHYAHQQGTLEQAGVHPNNCVIGSRYYFYSDGRVLTAAIGAPPPATPEGATLVSTQDVSAGNWQGVCADAAPASPLFPESRGWDVSSRDRHDVFGFGAKYDLGRVKLDANFTRALSRTRIGYGYNAAALGLSPTQVELAGTGLPDLVYQQNVFSATALVPVNRNLLVRVLVRYETGRYRDWHYDTLDTNPMPANNAAYLDAGPSDYRTTLVGVFLHLRM